MNEYTIKEWQDYWRLFDNLIDLLLADKLYNIVSEFKDAQKHVNGLTDGWYEFKFAFEKSMNSNGNRLTQKQLDIAKFLIVKLNESLRNG